jgi:hypothetical protein
MRYHIIKKPVYSYSADGSCVRKEKRVLQKVQAREAMQEVPEE